MVNQIRRYIVNIILFIVLTSNITLLNSLTLSASRPSNQTTPEKMEVHFIDVGQGDSTLITCDGHAMLIDTGDDSKGTTIQNYLQKQGIKELDFLVLTHPDSDHIGGTPVIITKFDIDNVFISNYEKDNKTYQKLIQALDYKRLRYSTPKVGTEYTLGTATITILAPNGEYDNPNDSSIALIVQNGNNRFLFTGDAGEGAEQDILNNKIGISADVYHAGHHGSKTSTSEDFFKAINPTYAIISCGEDNTYGHPHAQTLNTFRTNGVEVFRTDEQGTIIATSDGKKITFNVPSSETWKPGEPTGSSESQTQKEDISSETNNSLQEQKNDENKTSSITYVLNRNTKKFHYPNCSSVGTIKEKNREDSTLSRDEIIAKGYVPCKRCNP